MSLPTNNICPQLILAPETSPCIHGICNPITNNTCVCDEITWSSAGDIRFTIGLACDVHLPSILALWSLNLLIWILPFLISCRHFIVTGKNQTWTKAFNIKVLLVRIHLTIILTSLLWILCSILKLINPIQYNIGLHQGYTWLFWISAVNTWLLLWASNIMYANLFLATTPDNRVIERVYQLKIFFILAYSSLISGDCAIVAGYYLPHSSDSILMYFFFISAIGIGIIPIVASYIYKELIRQMQLVIETQSQNRSQTRATKRVKDLILWLSRINLLVIISMCGFIAIQSIVFGSLAIIRRSSLPYNTPILLIMGGLGVGSFARAGSNFFSESSVVSSSLNSNKNNNINNNKNNKNDNSDKGRMGQDIVVVVGN
jgi:hypothetical protein